MAIIGIDLGTTNSLVSVWRNGKPELIKDAHGNVLIPSVVGLDQDGNVTVGEVAKERLIAHPGVTAAEFKRTMGTSEMYDFDGKKFTSEELSSLVLRKLREEAEKALGEPVEEAVISVPAYFDDTRRSATKRAAELSGLHVERLVNEPSAAALAFLYGNNFKDGTYLVIDFGGGTLDISLVDSFNGVMEIIAVSGNNLLGGKDFNQAIYNRFLIENEILPDTLTEEQKASIYKMAENCKIALSTNVMSVMTVVIGDKKYSMTLDNEKLGMISENILQAIKNPIKRVLKDSRIKPNDIEDIILVGGTCKMPLVRNYISKLFARKLETYSDPDTAIAMGACIFAEMKNRNERFSDLVMTDICPFSLGIRSFNTKTKEDVMSFIIERNSPLPTTKARKFYAVGDNQMTFASEIYQGESIVPNNNKKVGEFNAKFPMAVNKGEYLGEVRFTYDINGILLVDVVTPDNKTHSMEIRNDKTGLTGTEYKFIKAKLEELRLSPPGNEEADLLIARAESLIEESLDIERDIIREEMTRFKVCIEHGNVRERRLSVENFSAFLDRFDSDGYLLPGEMEDDDDDDDGNWNF